MDRAHVKCSIRGHTWEQEETFGGDGFVYYLYYDNDFMGICPNSSNYINEMCAASLYINYNLVKLFFKAFIKKFKKGFLFLKY